MKAVGRQVIPKGCPSRRPASGNPVPGGQMNGRKDYPNKFRANIAEVGRIGVRVYTPLEAQSWF